MRGCHILVVDDDATIRETVAEFLQMEGFPVDTATNGSEALAVVEQRPPSIVLLDMRMPVLNGWDFARVLAERGLSLPLLVMTAARDAQQWAQEVRAVGCLIKPFDLSELLHNVERICAEVMAARARSSGSPL